MKVSKNITHPREMKKLAVKVVRLRVTTEAKKSRMIVSSSSDSEEDLQSTFENRMSKQSNKKTPELPELDAKTLAEELNNSEYPGHDEMVEMMFQTESNQVCLISLIFQH